MKRGIKCANFQVSDCGCILVECKSCSVLTYAILVPYVSMACPSQISAKSSFYTGSVLCSF